MSTDCVDCGVRHDYCIPTPRDGWAGGITLQEKNPVTGAFEPRDLTSLVTATLELSSDPGGDAPVPHVFTDADPELTIETPATDGRITWAVPGAGMEAVLLASVSAGLHDRAGAYYSIVLDWGDGMPETVLLGRVTAAARTRVP